MSVQENKALVRRFFEAVNACDYASYSNLFAFTFLLGGKPLNVEDFKRHSAGVTTSFPDRKYIIHEIFGEDDRVAARWTIEGTHLGRWRGAAPSGKRFQLTGMDIFRIVDGKIVERWEQADRLSLLQHFGAI